MPGVLSKTQNPSRGKAVPQLFAIAQAVAAPQEVAAPVVIPAPQVVAVPQPIENISPAKPLTRNAAKKSASPNGSSKKKTPTKRLKKSFAETRRYKDTNYTATKLNEALDKIRQGIMSIRSAAKQFKIPRSTLDSKLHDRHKGKTGRPFAFDTKTEDSFITHAVLLSDLGIPITSYDLREIAKGYLDSNRIIVPHFQNNRPGWDWAQEVISRFSDRIANKLPNNICKARADVTEKDISDYFDRLEKELEGVPPQNRFNFDESGFHDKPAKKKFLVRRKIRNPEMIRNSSKSCYTVLYCGNAVGTFLPPYLIFDGVQKWTDWLAGGPDKAKMNVSPSGWIEQSVFEDWFINMFVPFVEKMPGKKVLIGDDMSAHISIECLKVAKEKNISFVFLVPNSTHLLHPLDVGYFASLKSNWREVLLEWRKTKPGKSNKALPKNCLAQLLKQTLDRGKDTASDCLIKGFEASGIYPLDKAHVVAKLPRYAKTNEEINEAVGKEFKDFLISSQLAAKNTTVKYRKYQIPVEAGKAVSVEEVEAYYAKRQAEEDAKKAKKAARGRGRGTGEGRGRGTGRGVGRGRGSTTPATIPSVSEEIINHFEEAEAGESMNNDLQLDSINEPAMEPTTPLMVTPSVSGVITNDSPEADQSMENDFQPDIADQPSIELDSESQSINVYNLDQNLTDFTFAPEWNSFSQLMGYQ